jgi:flagellar M-ring protein FliF
LGGFLDFLKGLGAPRLVAMLAVTLTLIGFFGFVATRVSDGGLVPVFTDLTMQDASAVIKELEAQNIKYETNRDGSTILVPSDAVAQVRMKLAEQGLPSGGGVGWEIFDKGDGLSSTSFLQNVNRLRALEGELARSIRSLNRVSAARVHLVVPERPLFSRDAPKPTASIVLRVSGDLGQGEVRAIIHLVASAVQGLDPQAISIIDESGTLLANGGGDTGPDALPSGALEREAAFEKRLKDQVQGIVERVVGPGRARAEINAAFDYSKVTNTADMFDPESRVVRSTQTREEEAENREGPDAVTVANQLPNSQANNAGATANRDKSSKTDETVNYEISRTTRTEVLEAGRLKKVSVAVLVDGIYANDQSGSVSYSPRSQDELDRIASLVRSAIGFDQARGDQIEVVNLRFAEPPGVQPISDTGGMLDVTKDDLMRLIELAVLGIVSLLVLLLVVRPLVRRILTPDRVASTSLIPGPLAPHAPNEPVPLGAPDPTARMIELAQVNGKVHAQSLTKVGELAQRNPNETVSIIRQWLAEPA